VGGRGVPALAPTAAVLRMDSMAELAAFARGARAEVREPQAAE
jgi:hypothetical protein